MTTQTTGAPCNAPFRAAHSFSHQKHHVPSLRHHATRPLRGHVHPRRNRLHFFFHVYALQFRQCAIYGSTPNEYT